MQERITDITDIVLFVHGPGEYSAKVQLFELNDPITVPAEDLFDYHRFQGQVLKATGRIFVYDVDKGERVEDAWSDRVEQILKHKE